jgi:uncharacterized protein (DUF1330 family)
MAVYMIIEITIKDKILYSEYIEKVYGIVSRHGGKYIIRGGDITPISNNWSPERIIIIEFQDREQYLRCFQSPEYLQIAPLREQSTMSKAILVEGHNG